MRNALGLLSGAAIGAGVMYLADPAAGKRRRAILRDAARHLVRVFDRTADIATRDASNRMKGIVEEAKRFVSEDTVDDARLFDRVRAAVGRASSRPNVEVIVEDGRVTLIGPVVDIEERAVLQAAKSVRGVRGITSRMKPYRRLPSENIERSDPGHFLDLMHAHWSPATRLVMGSLGATIAAAGLAIGSRSTLAAVAGTALAVRAASNFELSRLVGVSSDTRYRAA